ncbi:MAG: hypothetical protein HKO98_12980 [Gemmatimonadetes bacterium]|nr:hypothetical protein [Gemmatimonadota bacterium]
MSGSPNRWLVPTAAIALTAAAMSCGDGGGTPTPPDDTGQTVTVQVTTTGVDFDADGYTVSLGSRSASVPPSGTATFDGVSAGSYTLRLTGFATNCYVEGSPSTTVTVSGSNGAQASISVQCTLDFGDGLATAACQTVSLAATSGMPGDRIGVEGTSGLGSPILGQVRTADASTRALALIDSLETGGLGMTTPLHPTLGLEGGPVWIRVTDGDLACAPIPFTIEALPAAEGELGSVVDLVAEVLRIQTAVLETTPEALAAVPLDQVPEPLLPLAVVQLVLDHPDNPSSLRAIANGTEGQPGTLDAIEALLATTGLRERLQQRVGGAQPTPTPLRSTVDPTTCTVSGIGQDTQRLSDCMGAAAQIRATLQALVNQAIIDRMGAALAATVAANGDQQATVRLVLGLIAWSVVNQELATWSRLPHSLQRIDVELNPARFGEDDDRAGTLDARLTAWNRVWRPEVHPFRNLMYDASPIYEVAQALGANTDALDVGLGLFIESQLRGRINARSYPREAFGPVPINDPKWSEVTWRDDQPGGRPSISKATHTTYRAARLGETSVHVATPGMDPTAFAGEDHAGSSPAAVDSIQIRIIPSDTIIDPTKQAVFLVAVENARFPDSLAVTTEQTSTAGFAAVGGPNNEFVLVYTPPANASFADPDSLHIEHTARYAARIGGPPRFDYATIRFGAVVISPQPSCIDVSEQVTFSAQVLGLDNQEVRWSTDVGTIGATDGVFRAPTTRPSGGVATIKAVSVEEPGLEAEAMIPIGCTCAFGFTLGGQAFAPQSGDQMIFTTDTSGPGARLINLTLTRPSQGWSVRMLPPTTDPNDWPNAPGTWPMAVQGDFGLTSPTDIIYATELDALGVATIQTLTPASQFRGSVAGTAELVSTANPGPIPFDWWFAIRYAPGEFICTVQ